MKPHPLLSVRDLTVTITGRAGPVVAAENISFDVAAGETLAIVGESGSGKSMTALSLVGLAPVGASVRCTGEAQFEGRDLLKLTEREMRSVRGNRIGTVFQDPSSSLNPLMSVGRQIGEAVRVIQRRRGDAAAGVGLAVTRLLDEVNLLGIPDIARRFPHELSGGQQQRVLIALALAGNPSLLIADEPTTALDASVQAQILELLKNLQRSRGMSMLMISHNLGLVADVARRIIILQKGRIVERGFASDVIADPQSAYGRSLVACVPRIGARLERLPTMDSAGRAIPTAVRLPTTTGPRPIMEVRNLVVSYPGRGLLAPEVRAVDGISLTVPHGHALGIVGESGSGKSTLAKTLVGLARPKSGTIHYREEVIHPERMSAQQRSDIQYIFQDAFGALNPRMNVEQAIGEPLSIHGAHRGAGRRDVVRGLLEEVGLAADHLDRFPRELSGGQRQRVTIARALALEPKVLICDEIVSALDVSVQAQILNLLKDLQEFRGLSLIFISHDLPVVAHMCSDIAVMKSGKIVEHGRADAILTSPDHSYTRALLRAAERLEAPCPDRLRSLTAA